MSKNIILRYTSLISLLVTTLVCLVGGYKINQLKEENCNLKETVRYLELAKEYKPVLEKSEAVRNSHTSFSRRLNEAVYINCRRLENSGMIFQNTVNENLLRSNNYVLRTIGAWQVIKASGKIILADLDGSLNL